MADSQDNMLVKNTLKGDAESFRRLVDRYKNPLIKLAYYLTRNRDDAEDLLQETFIRAYKNLDKFDQTKSLFSWLYTICKNLNINRLKKKDQILYEKGWPDNNNGKEPISGEDRSFGALTKGEQLIEQKRKKEFLDGIIHQVPDEYRDAVILRYQEELSYQEIARLLGISVSLAKVRVFRGIKKLRALIIPKQEGVL